MKTKTAPPKIKNGYIGFIRVSSAKQIKDSGIGLEVQETAVRNEVQRLGGVMLRLWKVPGESAFVSKKRKQFKEMLAYASENRDRVAGIMFPSVDRATRNHNDEAKLLDMMGEIGIRPRFADNPDIDLDSASGELVFKTLANIARYRSKHDSEKITASLKRVREVEGRLPGHAPYGYRNGRDDLKPVILPHERNAPIVQKIFDLYATGGYTVDSLRAHLVKAGIHYSPTQPAFVRSKLHAILRDRFYVGEINSKGEWYQGSHAPIIARSVFDKVQKLLGNRKQQAHDHPYAGRLLRCAYCDAAVVGEEIRKKTPAGETKTYHYYRCRDNKHQWKARATAAELDGQIAKVVAKIRLKDGKQAGLFMDVMRVGLAEAAKTRKRQVQEQQKRLADANDKRLKIVEMRLDTSARVSQADWQALYDRAEVESKAIWLELEALEREGSVDTALAVKTFELSQDIASRWVTFDWRVKRRLLDIVWLNCYWNGGALTPTWNKPFDLLAEGLVLKDGAEERT